jgi:putative ABC transport system permease protein
MKIGKLIQEAFKNLLSNKTRSLLTMLGVFIGVGAVIAMMSVGFGVKDSIAQEFNALGTNTMNVFQGNFSQTVRNPKPMTNEDVKKVAALDVVEKTAAFLGGPMQISKPGKKTADMMVYGMEPTYFSINNIKIAEGRNINEEDLRKSDAVIVIGSEVKKLMFGEEVSVLGESLRINGQPFTIVGVME